MLIKISFPFCLFELEALVFMCTFKMILSIQNVLIMFCKFGGSLATMEFNPYFYPAISSHKWGATHISIWPYFEAPT